MKKILTLLLCCALLAGCTAAPAETTAPTAPPEFQAPAEVVEITLLGNDATASGEGVSFSRDIVYYEDKTEYESGNPYGEGEDYERHSAEEAAAHLVVNITAPGTYRLSGKLEKGQIRIDLGEEACSDPNAVVNLILDGADITCTVAPAILFVNVYECDGSWSVENAKPDVDTSSAGANLILAENSGNTVNGSHVAKIYKDKEGEKKLVKQDGAIYSYMSMNVWGPGSLDLYADNEGLDTELHLSIFGGDIAIHAGNDGINTNEDGVSVTAIYGGSLRIAAGLGEEGDGIDSNGYLVIYGGTVISSANPAADAGLDSDLGSFIHGGTVIALGSAMDWAESDSGQVTMNLQFARIQTGNIRVLKEDGTEVFAFDPAEDPVIGQNMRSYQGAIISCSAFRVRDSYHVFAGGVQMAYTGTDVMQRPGGMIPGAGAQRPEGGMEIPEGQAPGDMPDPPEADFTVPPQPTGEIPAMPQGGQQPPAGTAPSMPAGEMPTMPQGGMPGGFGGQEGEQELLFYMQDKVNFFTGLTAAE